MARRPPLIATPPPARPCVTDDGYYKREQRQRKITRQHPHPQQHQAETERNQRTQGNSRDDVQDTWQTSTTRGA